MDGRAGNWRDNWAFGIITFIWAIITVPVWVMAILLGALVLGPHRSFWLIAPWFSRQLFAVCGIDWRIEGWEKVPAEIRDRSQPVIFMSNHESQLDPPFVLSAIPVPAVFIAKKELKWVPFIGWAAAAAGTIFIDRGDRDRAIRSIKEAAEKVRRGRSVVIFPEGTRTRTGELLPFKKGGFNLALEAGVPIIPIATVGGFQLLPKGGRRIRPGHYAVRFGEPVDPADFPERDALMAEVRKRMQALLSGL
ncbi:MAG TPA: lysophospholipid acyltransferase family protein [Holophagaceae bacterium]|nr:lysophospholipid acyltransferase family protein [Holophagaceae bacterium]